MAQGGKNDPAAPEAVVQRQLDASNARELDGFLETNSTDAPLFGHPSNLLAGR
ncbi:MAG TPA: hypothetical protein VG734_07185 [Lacunisphaera sp.]|nr:hypothetical protein [Lacunisphaera sp.]